MTTSNTSTSNTSNTSSASSTGHDDQSESLSQHRPERLIRIRPEAVVLTRQQLPYFVGISETTVGAKGISLQIAVIPPGASAEPHFHRDYETAIYILEGRVETRYGEGLKQSIINEAGDFLFVPPNVPHQPINLSSTEVVRALIARNDPNEQENVVLYPVNDVNDAAS